MQSWAPIPDTAATRTAFLSCNLAQVAATYDAGTVTGGDVLIIAVQPFVSVVAAGLTSVTVQSNNTTPDIVLASTLLAVLTALKNLTALVLPFVLPSGRKVQYTIVGTGTGAGVLQLAVRYQPLTAGARLA